jgi:hypothetical protein
MNVSEKLDCTLVLFPVGLNGECAAQSDIGLVEFSRPKEAFGNVEKAFLSNWFWERCRAEGEDGASFSGEPCSFRS